MEPQTVSTRTYAMHFGAYMGIYWTLKFILLPLSFTIPFLSFLFIGLTLGVPFMGYYYLKSFRDKYCGGYISFSKAMIFVILVYFFASMIVSVAHFIYFQYIDDGLVFNAIKSTSDQLLALNENSADYDLLKDTFSELLTSWNDLTATDITLANFSRNIYIGFILSIPTAILGKRIAKPTNLEE